jgi:sulfane dehydrogenase subunit SoxC
MVKQPLEFTMEDLLRYPAVSRFHFLECSGNGLTDWLKPASVDRAADARLLSCAQWTGIPCRGCLDEAGLEPGCEVGDASRAPTVRRTVAACRSRRCSTTASSSMRMNGEMLRAENGYPVAAARPGWEGNVSVKWLAPHRRSATSRGTSAARPRATPTRCPTACGASFSFDMECKSVITRPSGGMTISARDARNPGIRMVRERNHPRGTT